MFLFKFSWNYRLHVYVNDLSVWFEFEPKKYFLSFEKNSWNQLTIWGISKNVDLTIFFFKPNTESEKFRNFHNAQCHSVEKREMFFRQINYIVIYLVKPLISRNFQGMEIVDFY